MHKKSFFGGVLLLLFLTFVSPSQGGVSLLGETFPEGQAYGKVARVSGAHLITLELDLKHPFKVGDQLDLTYMAGMMPLPLGVFEVTSCQGKLVTVRPVTVMPDPRQGMQVIASIRRPDAENKRIQKTITKEHPPALDVSGMGPEPSSRSPEELERSLRMETKPSGPVVGKVAEVQGTDIFVSVADGSEKAVRLGQIVELFYVTRSGQELFVGKWKVTSVTGGRVKAARYEAVGKPKMGLKAVIRTNNG